MSKKNNKKSVYIALAADSIHHGHMNLIEVGRKYGEIIIGLITDSAIAEYKRIPYLNLEGARAFVELFRERNQKIVFTNGCFDILRAGHVKYLEAAKSKGDKLIVGINSDRSVSRLKGSKRPINKLIHRAKVLGSLRCVDEVVMFDEETPIKLIKSLKPDFLVKGGDYKVQDIVGYDVVSKYGGSVITIPLIKGLSTTKILIQGD